MASSLSLGQILKAIGVTGKEPAHHVTNIVSAIEIFAGLNGNPKLERECEEYRLKVRAGQETESD